MSVLREDYRRNFFSLLTKVAEEFTQEQCEKLSYIYQDKFTASFLDHYGKNPLKLLDHLLKEGTFSIEEPENLAVMMQDLGYLEKMKLVESFIDHHRVPANSIRGRALPPTPWPVQEEAESPYAIVQQVPGRSSTASITSIAAVNVEDQTLGDTPYIQVMSEMDEESPVVPNFNYSSDNEDIYEEIKCPSNILRHISHEIPPLLIERMEFLVDQLKYLIRRQSEEMLKSDVFHCPVLNFSFMLEVNPSDCNNVSAKLFLTATRTGTSTNKQPPIQTDNYFQVELQVGTTGVKQTGSGCSSSSSSSRTSPLSYVSKVMEHPVVPDTSSEVPTNDTASTSDVGILRDKVCVASFPSLLSHATLLDKTLVTHPYLIFTLTLRHRPL